MCTFIVISLYFFIFLYISFIFLNASYIAYHCQHSWEIVEIVECPYRRIDAQHAALLVPLSVTHPGFEFYGGDICRHEMRVDRSKTWEENSKVWSLCRAHAPSLGLASPGNNSNEIHVPRHVTIVPIIQWQSMSQYPNSGSEITNVQEALMRNYNRHSTVQVAQQNLTSQSDPASASTRPQTMATSAQLHHQQHNKNARSVVNGQTYECPSYW